MNTLLFSGLLLGVLGANPDGATYPMLSDDLQNQTYECSAACFDECDDCCDEPCGRPCGRGACCDRTPCGPLTFVFSIFNANTWRGPVCGERYWGDFYSDPPECCDPCDACGDYVGPTTNGGNWGNSRGYSSGSGDCKNCNKNRVFDDQPIPQESRAIYPSTRMARQPMPTRTSSRTVRTR